MCSILGIFDFDGGAGVLRDHALEISKLQRHRGPDWSGIYSDKEAILVHERLAIVDLLHGAQPLFSDDGRYVLAVNGEIYNHLSLRKETPDYTFQTGSDCEIIIPLYMQYGADFVGKLNGIFAFILYDTIEKKYIVARDPVGVVPLYSGTDTDGRAYFASELKAIQAVCPQVEVFPPGHIIESDVNQQSHSYVHRTWLSYDNVEWRLRSCTHSRGTHRRSTPAADERRALRRFAVRGT